MAQPQEEASSPAEFRGKWLDASAQAALSECLSNLRESLLHEAARTSPREVIDDDRITDAYRQLAFPARDSLRFSDAQAVISHALRENQFIERVSYAMAIVLFLFGLTLLSVGVGVKDATTRIGAFAAGSIVELLILVPFRFAINSRRHNIALRMLGIILDRVDDPAKLAPLLKDTFVSVVLGKASFNVDR